MPSLTLKFKDNVIKKYRLEQKKSLTIGRRDDNDIFIENLAVSGYHAKIDSVGEEFLLTDLKSKNGTFVNSEQIVTHFLKDQDIITIGKHTLVFSYAKVESQPDPNAMSMDQTMVIDTSAHKEMLQKTFSTPPPDAEPQKQIGILSFLSGGEGEVELDKKLIKIGKDSASDILLSGFTIGKTAATISNRPNGYFVSYVAGMSKLKVNGQTIKESTLLNEFDTIEIGSYKMQFIYK